MSYQPGRMGLAGGIALIFVTTSSPLFLSLFSINAEKGGNSAWLLPLLSLIDFLVVLYPLLYVLETTGKDLYGACEELLGTVAARLIALYLIGVYFLDAVLLLRQFTENTLITALPGINFEFIVGWYILLVVFLLYRGLEPMVWTSYIIMPVAVAGMILLIILVWSRFHLVYLTPWQGTGLDRVVLQGLLLNGINFGALLPFIFAVSFQNAATIKRSVFYGLGLSVAVRSMVLGAYMASFGAAATQEKVLPFFELARLVYINRFIQRIEALYILLWVMMGMLNIAIDIYAGLYLTCRLFNLPALRPLIAPAAVVIAELSMLPSDVMSVIVFYSQAITTIYSFGTAVLPLVLFLAALLRTRRQKSCPSG
ncbi:MAG: GerAB/ArcD/ProY family transporter [Negativicutes bacterium]|nr:GerAB/ArcD/ProY family transporter [Negativicutes bacterium]